MGPDELMDGAAALVEFLGKAAGENCEVLLLDLREGKHCVTAIANGHISGRSVGAPPTDLVLRMVNRGLWKTRDYVCNYRGRAAGKRLLRCSTLFIKSGGELLGMLCINVDTSSYVSLSEGILRLAGIEPEAFPRPAKGKARGEDLYRDREAMIKAVLEEMGIEGDAAGKLTQENRLPVIERLMEQGVFLLRGSVSSVARKLRCSEASLYRYIGVLNKRKAEELGGRS